MSKMLVDEANEPTEEDFSDSEMWAAWKAMKRSKRHQRILEFDPEALAIVLESPVTKHTDYHYSFELCGKSVDYWPSSTKWRVNNKTHHGGFMSLCGFIKNRKKKGKL